MPKVQFDSVLNILYRSWLVESPSSIFLLVHGLGAHSGRWNELAEYFLSQNISSYAIELKGFGETEGQRGHVDSLDIYSSGITTLYTLIHNEYADKKIFIVSESMGALLSLIACAKNPNIGDGLVCISPAFSSKLKFSLIKILMIIANALINPNKEFELPFDSRMCTRDAEMQRIMDADPNESRIATAGFLWKIFLAQKKVKQWAQKVTSPLLFLSAGEDHFIYPEVSKKVFDIIRSQDKKFTSYPGMFHALSVELGREEVFEDLYSWVKERV